MHEECLLVVLVPVEQQDEFMIEELQEMLVTKQGVIEQMRRYHLDTTHVEREIEQVQCQIERLLVK